MTNKIKRDEFSRYTKAKAFLRCNGKCENRYCARKLTTDIVNYDHIIAAKILSDHGIKSNTLGNCQCLCKDCHVRLKTPSDMREIVKVRKQNIKHGEAATVRSDKAVTPRAKNKSQWVKRPFQKPPKGYKHWR